MQLDNKKHRKTARAKGWDYGSVGFYFVTICTKKKIQWFGEVRSGQMLLSEIGKIANRCWKEIPQHFPYVKLDAYMIMPNHLHGIIEIARRAPLPLVVVGTCESHVPTTTTTATTTSTSMTPTTTTSVSKFSLKPKSLGSIINQCKGTVTKRIRDSGYSEFQWQPRFHDRILRSSVELQKIRNYILSNPSKWDKEAIPWHDDPAFWPL